MTDHSLADRIAIQDVMLHYAAGCDERDFAEYRACFCDDVEIVGFTSETLCGIDAVLAFVKPGLGSFGPTQHLLSPALISVSGDTAHARSDVQALHYFKEPEGRSLTLWGKYETDLVRVGDGWKIKKHQLIVRGTRTAEAK